MNATIQNASKLASEVVDNEKKKKEQDEREKEAERLRIKKQAEELACYYLRVGGIWYKNCIHPITGQAVRERITARDLMEDYGRKLAPAIMSAAPKYINEVNMPDHLHYQECIKSASGDYYLNTYKPLSYKPSQGGDFHHIRSLVSHIFGEQVEMGYDYLQLLYTRPTRKLPALLLVSRQTSTGKSTFCFFLAALFGDNAVEITPETFRSKFASTWLSKLLVYCEETMLNKPEDFEKAKNLVTAAQTPSEKKGKDWNPTPVFMKFVFCSNNEDSPVLLDDQDSRFWVRKVPRIKDKNPNEDFMEECKKEIPNFLYWLGQRKLTTTGTDRLWFTPEETRTDAWRKIVAGSRDTYERSLINLLLDIMKVYQVDELRYSKTELNEIVRKAPQFSDSDRRKSSDILVKKILQNWELKATAKTRRHNIYALNSKGQKLPFVENRSSNIYIISRSLLQSLVD